MPKSSCFEEFVPGLEGWTASVKFFKTEFPYGFGTNDAEIQFLLETGQLRGGYFNQVMRPFGRKVVPPVEGDFDFYDYAANPF